MPKKKKKDTADVVKKFTEALKGSGAIDVPALQNGLMDLIGGESGLAGILHQGYENSVDYPQVQARYVEMILDVLIPKGQETGDNLNTASDEDLYAVLGNAAEYVSADDEDTDEPPPAETAVEPEEDDAEDFSGD